LIRPRPRDSLVNVAYHCLRWLMTMIVLWCLPCRSHLALNSSWCFLRCSRHRLRKLLLWFPSSGSRGIRTASQSGRSRIERGSWWRRLGSLQSASSCSSSTKMLSPSSYSHAHSKNSVCTRHGFIKCDLAGLHDAVSLQIKYAISSRMRSIM